jgi:hypothetical protein
MKKIIGQIIFFTLILSSVSFANIYDLELNVGNSVLEARFNATLPLEENFLKTGIGAIYKDDDYKLVDATVALSGEAFFPELTFNLGFKGLLGNMEEGVKDGDLMAVGFLLAGKYAIPEIILPIPVDFTAGFTYAPDPLCFSDSEKYLEMRAGLDFHIISSGIITLGYRYIKADFENNYGKWDKSDDTLFIGFRILY